ncbi:MAG: hypothetical protein NVV72_01060 [Asticcacaulis sp.]|nr:hypothetical protein [Asticcacaulis sp.]
MSSHEDVDNGCFRLVKAALPHADVHFNPDKAPRVSAGGYAEIKRGESVLIDTELGQLRYIYERKVPCVVMGYESATLTRDQFVDRMLVSIGDAVEANRRLNFDGQDRCDWVDLDVPDPDDATADGAETVGGALFYFVVTYGTANPLK